ncbi:hemolysin family protein [Lachnospiraceae bacterium 62-35]
MDGDYSEIKLLVFLLLIFLEVCFYGFAAALEHVNTSELEEELEAGNKKAAVFLKAANKPERFLCALQVLGSLTAAAAGAYLLGGWIAIEGLKPAVAKGLEGIICIILLVSFGIIIPQKYAAENPKVWGYAVLQPVLAAALLLRPLVWAIMGISWFFLKITGIDLTASQDNVTEEDIMSMVNEGHEQGVLEASEAEMITNIFHLDDKKAEEIMTHRKNVVALDGMLSLKEAVRFILEECNNSRFPVYGEDMDDIIGILHMRDAIVFTERDYGDKPLREIPGLIRKACFIPESRNIHSLFQEMQSEKIHMEIVVDEYGQMAGIVTMEDILEEIVGNIMDEYDEEEEYIRFLSDGSYIINGMASLDDVEEKLEITFTEEENGGEEGHARSIEKYETINGFLISRLGRIPGEEERPAVSFGGYCFQVLKVENKMISIIKAIREAVKGPD